MSKGHHTTLLWNVFTSSVSRTTLKKSIDQVFQVCFSFLKGIIYFFSFVYKYVHNSKISSVSRTVSLDVILLSFVTEHPWSNQHRYAGIRQGGFCLWTSTGLQIANEEGARMEGNQPLILHCMAPGWAAALYWSDPVQDTGCRVPHELPGWSCVSG